MFKLAVILPLLRSLAPALLVLAHAFRYGMQKHGDGTWKNRTAEFHVGKAMSSIGQWFESPMSYYHLANAGLRLMFALTLVGIKEYEPKEKPANETKSQ